LALRNCTRSAAAARLENTPRQNSDHRDFVLLSGGVAIFIGALPSFLGPDPCLG
jgi:hypothetical protein